MLSATTAPRQASEKVNHGRVRSPESSEVLFVWGLGFWYAKGEKDRVSVRVSEKGRERLGKGKIGRAHV